MVARQVCETSRGAEAVTSGAVPHVKTYRCPWFGDCPPRVDDPEKAVKCGACGALILAPQLRQAHREGKL